MDATYHAVALWLGTHGFRKFLLDSGFPLEYVLGLGRWHSVTIVKRHYDRSKKANLGLSAQAG